MKQTYSQAEDIIYADLDETASEVASESGVSRVERDGRVVAGDGAIGGETTDVVAEWLTRVQCSDPSVHVCDGETRTATSKMSVVDVSKEQRKEKIESSIKLGRKDGIPIRGAIMIFTFALSFFFGGFDKEGKFFSFFCLEAGLGFSFGMGGDRSMNVGAQVCV